MPRNGSGVFQLPGTYEATAGETILAEQHNDPLEDLEQDANTVRPIVAGGTGVDTAIEAADAFSTKGANVASATTTDLSTATGRYVHITGTTTITGLGTATAGIVRILTFDGALTLTHNATSLILPGGANITTAAGDVAVMVSEGGGNWRCAAYRPATGLPIIGAGKGAAIASATTISIGSAGFYHITGTTTITDIDFTVAGDGRWAILEFDGALTLTHHATTLVLPGGASIGTAAGDTCMVVQDSGDNIHVVWYQRAAGAVVMLPPVTATSGTSHSFSIPSWAKEIVISFVGLSTNGTSALRVRVNGNASGYLGGIGIVAGSPSYTAITDGFGLNSASATAVRHGQVRLSLVNAATGAWACAGESADTGSSNMGVIAGSTILSADLVNVSVTTVNGTDAFDAGLINVTYF